MACAVYYKETHSKHIWYIVKSTFHTRSLTRKIPSRSDTPKFNLAARSACSARLLSTTSLIGICVHHFFRRFNKTNLISNKHRIRKMYFTQSTVPEMVLQRAEYSYFRNTFITETYLSLWVKFKMSKYWM